MDHLDRPKHAAFPQYKIAYVCLEPYDGGDFASFPSRQGFETEKVLDCDFKCVSEDANAYHDLPKIQSLLQAWLFFGLIHEVHAIVGLLFEESDYTSNDVFTVVGDTNIGKIRRLNTAGLPHLISLWLETSKELEFEAVREQCRRIDDCLQTAYRICYRLVKSTQPYLDENILLSFMCLGNAIEGGNRLVFNRCFYDALPEPERHHRIPEGWIPDERGWDAPSSLFQKLLFNGWCRYEVEILRRDFKINEIIYASQLPRYGNRGRHVNCKSTGCTANNVDEATYQTQHRPDCKQDCQVVEFDYQQICNILESGDTPLVLSDLRSGCLEFYVVPRTVPGGPQKGFKFPYVCISHVWSHGLGNTQRNILPRCQLEALNQATMALLAVGADEPIPCGIFWIDTICVPVQPSEDHLRKKAISNMAQVYREAQHVLVLDEALMWTSLKSVPSATMKLGISIAKPEEIIRQKELVMSILFSDWWRRLWTLQEGLLPNHLWILFAEGVVNLGQAVQAGNQEHVSNRADMSSETVKLTLHNLIDKADYYGTISKLDRYRQVISLLCNRSTSRASDEPICLATLMGINVRPILDAPEPERMKTLYKSLNKVPAGLAFLDGPKMDEVGFRWAPRSYIVEGGPTTRCMQVILSEEEDYEATVTANGLRLQAIRYPLVTSKVRPMDNFFIFPGDPGYIPSEYDAANLTDRQKALSNQCSITAVVQKGPDLQHDPWKEGGRQIRCWDTISDEAYIDPVLILPKKRRLDTAQSFGILVAKPIRIDGVWHAR